MRRVEIGYTWYARSVQRTHVNTAAKLLLIVFYIFIASPTATHAIIDAGYEFRVPYWTRSSKKKRAQGEETTDENPDNGFYPEELKG